jgi:dolichyl-phosphate-mannose--protein O-mannosyl transferase
MVTERNLHTHRVQSPLSMQQVRSRVAQCAPKSPSLIISQPANGGSVSQEISCFQAQDSGDTNDDWLVVCNAAQWDFGRPVRIESSSIGGYLHSHSQHRFSQQNCPTCPIIGQQEVTCFGETNSQNVWRAEKGLTHSR